MRHRHPIPILGLVLGLGLGLAAILDLWGTAQRGGWPTFELVNAAAAVLAGGGLGMLLGLLVGQPGWKRALLATSALLVLLAAGAGVAAHRLVHAEALLPDFPERAGAPADAPDIYVLLLDAVSADGIFDESGTVWDHLPHLKSLAAEATVFPNAFTVAPWTIPSHASLFSGLLPVDHETTAEATLFPSEHVTLAERLQEHGYRTLGISANPWLAQNRGFAQGFDVYEEVWHQESRVPPVVKLLDRVLTALQAERRQTKKTDLALRKLRASIDAPGPRFTFVNLISAHPVLGAPRPFRDDHLSDEMRERGDWCWKVNQDWAKIYTGAEPSTEVERALFRQLYNGEIAYMDAQIGVFLDELRASGRWDDAMIVVTSDHGCGLLTQQALDPALDLGDDMLRIPLLIKEPHATKARRVEDAAQIHDLYPTLLAAAGVRVEHPARDGDARDILGGPPREIAFGSYARPMPLLYVLWQDAPRFDRTLIDRRLLSAQRGPFKLIWSSRDGEKLIKMDEDPQEWVDRSADFPLVVDEFRNALRQGLNRSIEEAAADLGSLNIEVHDTFRLDPETVESLKSLGYISGGS